MQEPQDNCEHCLAVTLTANARLSEPHALFLPLDLAFCKELSYLKRLRALSALPKMSPRPIASTKRMLLEINTV